MTSVEFVEKALIGSLLNDSTRRDEVLWLDPEDFTNPLYRAIWRHLDSGDPPRCQPLTDLVGMSELLGRSYELHAILRSPAELATLQLQAPEKPAVAEYGRILVEATVRREIGDMGLQLESLTTGEPEQIIDRIVNALTLLERLDQRREVSAANPEQLDADHQMAASSLPTAVVSQTNASCSENAGTIGDGMDHQMAEKAVIGAAVHDWPPGARAQVLETVRECDFIDPRTSATWRTIEFLAEHDAAIDEVTVAWKVLRERSRAGQGLTVPELRDTRGAAIFYEAGAGTLARSTLNRVAVRAKTAITRCSDDQGINLTTVINSATTQYVAVAAAAQRLIGERSPHKSLTQASARARLPTRSTPTWGS